MSDLKSIIDNPYSASKITILEGPDGVGKSYSVNLIKEAFSKTDRDLRLVRCPDNRGGAAIRNVIMSKELEIHPDALMFLFLADFVYAFDSIIKPELDNPNVYFLFDRFIPSTCIYQKVDVSYLNKVMARYTELCSVFSKAQYIYLHPSDFEEHKRRLSYKKGDEVNHLDPVGDEAIRNNISDYAEFQRKHKLFGLLGSFYAERVLV